MTATPPSPPTTPPIVAPVWLNVEYPPGGVRKTLVDEGRGELALRAE